MRPPPLSPAFLSPPQTAFLKREGLDYSAVPPSEMTAELAEKLRQVALATGGDKEEAAAGTPQQQGYYRVRGSALGVEEDEEAAVAPQHPLPPVPAWRLPMRRSRYDHA